VQTIEAHLPPVRARVTGGLARDAQTGQTRPLSGLEMFFIVYTSFGAGQFFNTFISFQVGKYIFAGYVHLFLLTCWWGLLMLRKESVKTLAGPVLIVLGGILGIEAYHVWRVGVGVGEVTGVKAILYNPLYVPLINLVMFVLILHEYRTRRIEVIKFVVKAATGLTVLGMIMWVLVYSGVIRFPESETTTAYLVLNNNTGAYVSVFVLYCLFLTTLRYHIRGPERTAYAFLAVTSVFLYTCRGAMLVIGFYAATLVFRRLPRGKVLAGAGAAMAAGMLILMAMRTDTGQEYYRVFLALADQMARLRDYTGPFLRFDAIDLSVLTRQRPSDSLISAVGRIFASVIAIETFTSHPALGVGTYTAYKIEAYGAGVHSLPFLYAASSGVLGIALLAGLFSLMGHGRSVARHHLLYLLPVGVFLNTFPLWYACCFFLDPDTDGSRERRSASAAAKQVLAP
jgi:hypothetical protein